MSLSFTIQILLRGVETGVVARDCPFGNHTLRDNPTIELLSSHSRLWAEIPERMVVHAN